MTIQVLVATMHQTNHSLLEKMNIRSDAIVGNQCDRIENEKFEWNGNRIEYLSSNERGTSRNRQTALNHANAEVVLFADDDVVYNDDYVDTIENVYREHPEADVVIFNMKVSRNGEQLHDLVLQDRYVGRRGVSKFGMFCVSARTQRLRDAEIEFNLLFGGGAKYGCGEDTIFLQDCVKNGLKVYTSTQTLGTVIHGDSTWFSEYNDKYFFDKGCLFATIYPSVAHLLSAYHVIKHTEMYGDYGIKKALLTMWKGVDSRKKEK